MTWRTWMRLCFAANDLRACAQHLHRATGHAVSKDDPATGSSPSPDDPPPTGGGSTSSSWP